METGTRSLRSAFRNGSCSVPWPPSCTLFHVQRILYCSMASFPYPVPCSLHPALFPGDLNVLSSMFPASCTVPWPPSQTLFHVPCILYCSLSSFPYPVPCSLYQCRLVCLQKDMKRLFPTNQGCIASLYIWTDMKSRFLQIEAVLLANLHGATVSYHSRLVCLKIDMKRLFPTNPSCIVWKLHGMAVSNIYDCFLPRQDGMLMKSCFLCLLIYKVKQNSRD